MHTHARTHTSYHISPSLSKAAGYATALVGKTSPLTSPTRMGFEYFVVRSSQRSNIDP